MKLLKWIGYAVLLLGLSTLIVLMNGEGETAVSAEDSLRVNGLPNVTTSLVASGFNQPVDIVHAGDERLFIVEQAGVIRIIDSDGTVLPTPFLDITDRVEDGGETGLLSLAFDPYFEDNGYFYVSYTYCIAPACPDDASPTSDLSTRISRFELSSDPFVANPNSEILVMEVPQPYSNHNGGKISFGPDTYLYIGLGDGGRWDDVHNNAQNMTLLLGKMLRIDVHNGPGNAPDCDSDGNYVIPTGSGHFGNPFVDGAGGNCDEIWALGLRNPWRFSFDRSTGSMFIGDVGQQTWEEINYQPANGGGENWGWRCYEGNHEFNMTGCGDISDYDYPIAEYAHEARATFIGCAVSGGYIYRGSAYPALQGYYFFGDWCSGNVWLSLQNIQGEWDTTLMGTLPGVRRISTFGEDCMGELYIADHYDGEIYQIQSLAQTNNAFRSGSDEMQYLPIVFRPEATATTLPTSSPNPTPTFTPSPTSISPDQCVS